MTYNNCTQCQYHAVIADPDPYDWFCDDDVAVVCTRSRNEERDVSSEYDADKSFFKLIVRSCRPHRVAREATVPVWCPLRSQDKPFRI